MAYVRHQLKDLGFPGVTDPGVEDLGPLPRLLDPAFLAVLETAWDDWNAAGCGGEVITTAMPCGQRIRRMGLPTVFA